MIDKALFLVYNIIVVMSEDVTGYMQTYRSGHNGADSKSVRALPPRVRISPSPPESKRTALLCGSFCFAPETHPKKKQYKNRITA